CIEAGCVLVLIEDDTQLLEHMATLHTAVVAARAHTFERLYSRVTANAGAANPLQRAIFGWAMNTGSTATEHRVSQKSTGSWLSIKLAVAHRLVFKQLHDLFGGRLRFFFAAGGPLLESAQRFFDAAGVQILSGYANTEAGGFTHVDRPDAQRFGSAGSPLDGVS